MKNAIESLPARTYTMDLSYIEKSRMKKNGATAQHLFVSFKYLLLTALLILIAMFIGQYILKNLGVEGVIASDFKHSMIPFLGTAAVSMFLTQRFTAKKD